MAHTTAREPIRPQRERLLSEVRRFAFWGSILLPLGYVPLLSTRVLSEVLGSSALPAVAGLVLLNVVCLLVGHGHDPDHDR